MTVQLKIKSKHLATEPSIIKHEEKKLKKQRKHLVQMESYDPNTLRNINYKLESLISHRRSDVRNESRATFLARAYIKGMPYNKVEDVFHSHKLLSAYNGKIIKRAADMVCKYGPLNMRNTTNGAIVAWITSTN